MITQEKLPWSIIKFSQLILYGNVWRSVWRICMWILGRKGLSSSERFCLKMLVLISLSHMVNGVQLAQLEGFWSTEQEVVSPNPGRTTFIPTKVFEKIKTVRSY